MSRNETAASGLHPNTAHEKSYPNANLDRNRSRGKSTAPGAGRYHPPLERLLKRRHRRIVAAALRLEEAHVRVREARLEYGRGTPECRRAVEERKDARRSLLYHAAELRREDAS